MILSLAELIVQAVTLSGVRHHSQQQTTEIIKGYKTVDEAAWATCIYSTTFVERQDHAKSTIVRGISKDRLQA
ncbi:hypothetical protein G6F42_018659 [Rhizopus arrhizus]|nr:hypothetical protein G6F42_018659 [Rhizopus arrhizus]